MKKTHYITEPIIFTATRLESIANRYIFVPIGTTAAMMKILGLLKKKGPMTPVQIMNLAGGTKSNVSQRLNTLEKSNLIVRSHAVISNDRRKVMVKLTFKGKEQMEMIKKQMRKAQLCLSKHFTEREIRQHIEFFEKINEILDKGEKDLGRVFKK